MPEANVPRLAYAMAHLFRIKCCILAQHKRICHRHANAADSLYIPPSNAHAPLASVAVEPMQLELRSVCSCVYRRLTPALMPPIESNAHAHATCCISAAVLFVTSWV